MEHIDFSDVPLLTPIGAQIGLSGPIDAAQGVQILNDYNLAFFNRYLVESGNHILENIADKYPEVRFESN